MCATAMLEKLFNSVDFSIQQNNLKHLFQNVYEVFYWYKYIQIKIVFKFTGIELYIPWDQSLNTINTITTNHLPTIFPDAADLRGLIEDNVEVVVIVAVVVAAVV